MPGNLRNELVQLNRLDGGTVVLINPLRVISIEPNAGGWVEIETGTKIIAVSQTIAQILEAVHNEDEIAPLESKGISQ